VEGNGDGTVRVRTGGGTLVVRCPEEPPRPGERVHVRYRPEDVVLSPLDASESDGRLSARNRLPVTVRSLTPAGGLIRVRLSGPPDLAALITRDSADRLGLRVGAPAMALLKTTALSVYRTRSQD
jgi:molybdopterin-binding protein